MQYIARGLTRGAQCPLSRAEGVRGNVSKKFPRLFGTREQRSCVSSSHVAAARFSKKVQDGFWCFFQKKYIYPRAVEWGMARRRLAKTAIRLANPFLISRIIKNTFALGKPKILSAARQKIRPPARPWNNFHKNAGRPVPVFRGENNQKHGLFQAKYCSFFIFLLKKIFFFIFEPQKEHFFARFAPCKTEKYRIQMGNKQKCTKK